ncbi:Glycosyltransferase involved in cell wall bisynthesis [Bradyrhizobium sp. Ghvi]|uniref:glycosyltransferase n=1 Tax=Bradyrhizobium sp. Ghvi TaxID=1855319 RepID=UPI0008EB5A6B|nr:glycosyltransferase [Bradyrhizobium sp. Ghvi]SFQ31894.1 Glycosyltransferase involved in cell wall bisynthesis [Bradyrhizobium sp. Ghvi]
MPGSLQRPVKVLHIAETIRGGIASYLNELHPQQEASFGAGNVHYVVPSDHRGDLAVDDAQMTTFGRSGRSVSGLFQMLRASLQAIDAFKPNVVHLHSSFAGLVLRPALAARPQAPSVIYCPHGWAFSRKAGRVSHQITKAAENLLARTTDRIICISADEFNEAIRAGISADRLTLVHNGISKTRPQPVAAPWPTKKTKVLFIGRLDRQKGYDLLIEAARLLEDVLDVRIVGASVVNKYQGPAVPSNVTLLGWLDRGEIETHLEAADLVVIPSRWEAFGLVALEAMRAAKPILAFRIGALPEIVVDGATGALCEPVSAGQLVEGFRRMLDLDLKVLGNRGYDRFKQFYDVEKTHRQLRQVYMDVLERNELRPEKQVQLQSDLSSNI